MNPFITRLITRVSVTVTVVILLFMAVTVQMKDDTSRVICTNMTVAGCNAVQNDSYN